MDYVSSLKEIYSIPELYYKQRISELQCAKSLPKGFMEFLCNCITQCKLARYKSIEECVRDLSGSPEKIPPRISAKPPELSKVHDIELGVTRLAEIEEEVGGNNFLKIFRKRKRKSRFFGITCIPNKDGIIVALEINHFFGRLPKSWFQYGISFYMTAGHLSAILPSLGWRETDESQDSDDVVKTVQPTPQNQPPIRIIFRFSRIRIFINIRDTAREFSFGIKGRSYNLRPERILTKVIITSV